MDAVGRRNPVVVAVGSRMNNAKLEGTKVINARHGRSGRGRARADLGDTMCDGIGVADLGGRILKWAKTDEKL